MPTKLIVIDSQSLFDWMVFRNPVCADWASALGGQEWEWIFTSEMKAEFDFVAAKGFGERWPVDAAALAATWARHGRGGGDARRRSAPRPGCTAPTRTTRSSSTWRSPRARTRS